MDFDAHCLQWTLIYVIFAIGYWCVDLISLWTFLMERIKMDYNCISSLTTNKSNEKWHIINSDIFCDNFTVAVTMGSAKQSANWYNARFFIEWYKWSIAIREEWNEDNYKSHYLRTFNQGRKDGSICNILHKHIYQTWMYELMYALNVWMYWM